MTEAGSRPLRIGLFTNNYFPVLGGVSVAVETLRLGLERAGHEVMVVAPRAPHADDSGRRVVRVPGWPAPTHPEFCLPLPLGPRQAAALEALGLDVFHAHHPFLLGPTARRLARRAGRPLVFTYHTRYEKYAHYVPLPRPLVIRQAMRLSAAFADSADLVTVPSEALAARLRAQHVRSRIAVLPVGVDLTRFRPGDRATARRALRLPERARLLLYVGRLDREKNLEFLLDAFARVSGADPEVELLLVGRGSQAAALESRLTRKGAARRVHLVGGVQPGSVPLYCQAADAFVFASTTETQGLAVIEAMACGIPVVAVRASGVEDAVTDGVSGLLVAEDTEAFAAAVGQVLDDPALVAKLVAGGRKAAEGFAAERSIARMVALYRSLLAGTPVSETGTPSEAG